MMSGLENIDHPDSLFSFELLVENIRFNKEAKVSDELAVGVRLLDFPTLLIYQHQENRGGDNQQKAAEEGEHVFNRGKCCFFKMNRKSLHSQLSNTPLYAMLLDVKEDIPKLVGTSLISLNKVMKRIRQDVTEHGLSAPSSHGERGLVGVCNLRGEKIGSMSLSYKMQSLGSSLLQHATERKAIQGNNANEELVKDSNKPAEVSPLDCGNASSTTQDKTETLQNNDNQDQSVCNEHNATSQTPEKAKESQFEEASPIFRPPHLFYCNTAEERSKHEADCTSLNPNLDSFTLDDSEEESRRSTVAQSGKQDVKSPENRGTSGVTLNAVSEAIQQLPLLNALLVELSQLNGQSPQQPLSVHPNLAWIYRPASAETSAMQNKSLHKTKGISPNLKHLHSPRNCSTPSARPASSRVKDRHEESQSYSTSPRKRLVFGTTKTFNLRLKQASPLKGTRRECVELIQNKMQASMPKEKKKTSNKIKSSKRKSDLKQSSVINENIETMIENVAEDLTQQQTITLQKRSLQESPNSLRNSVKPSFPERKTKFIHIPSAESDISPQNRDMSEHHSESDQSDAGRHRGSTESSRSSRHSSSKSSFSDSAGGNVEDDYADDFNSLEPSDTLSPDALSSPELSRAKTPKSPVRPPSASGSEGVHRRAVLPVPVKAPSSPPQRALRGTHIIRPRTQGSALSFSSDDADRDTSASIQTILSRKATESSREGRSSFTDSLTSPGGLRRESTRDRRAARGLSTESASSFDPEEVEDELGSLDFKQEYKHISELVANKLPGYTM
ncbi:microtubule-associated protein 10 [Cheilinus undulatus]|uniref:microtubule-associated protein 10 n=1 Tax=Cheilinus undulatus TaxID=241271 RepID=UPI001BD497DF|nr:microtubule-associated protein 10 [Cheilinus undulatus]